MARTNPRDRLQSAIVLFIMAAIMFALAYPSPPPRDALAEAAGHPDSVEKVYGKSSHLSGVRFRLQGDPRNFQYDATEGKVDEVLAALRNATTAVLRVRFDPAEPHQSWFDGRRFHTVYEIEADQRIVRSYDQAWQSLRQERLLSLALGSVIALGGLAMLFAYSRQRARDEWY